MNAISMPLNNYPCMRRKTSEGEIHIDFEVFVDKRENLQIMSH